jgi:hypothetical protein
MATLLQDLGALDEKRFVSNDKATESVVSHILFPAKNLMYLCVGPTLIEV